MNRLNLLAHRLEKTNAPLRAWVLRLRGLKMEKGKGFIGRITCKWPHKISLGKSCVIEDGVDFKFAHPFSDTNNIRIGDQVFIGRCCEFHCKSNIVIGNNTLIASNCSIIDVGHETNRDKLINQQPVVSKDIIIGNDVWVGSRSTILMGITIGDGAVIAAGSVVNKPVPPYEIWGGVPAKFLKQR